MNIDERCARIAAQQFGIITRDQALQAGMSAQSIRWRIESGRWQILHPGVYCIAGAPRSWERDLMAAVLWAKGIASHRAAAAWWGLPGFENPPLELTVWHCRLPSRCGLLVHSTKRLPREQMAVVKFMPVTSIERTLLDIGAVVTVSRVAIALDDALRRKLTSLDQLDRCLHLTARRGRRGTTLLRRLVREREELPATPHSPLETRVLRLLRQLPLPEPQLQYEIRDEWGNLIARPDFVYPESKLIIEADSYKWHSGREAWAHDLDRRNAITALGYRVVHLTSQDVRQKDRTGARVVAAYHEGQKG